MARKLTALFIFMLCIGLVGCGSDESKDAQKVSAAADAEQAAEVDEIDETVSTDDLESDEGDQNTVTDNETDINTETAPEEQANTDDSETDIEPEAVSFPEYEVTELDEPMVMYASTSVNVRQGPSTDFEIVGSLKPGRDVTVTGQADTDWYEILYNEEKVFVSNQ